ncbi:MAG: signal peptide protein [Verrucomicrobiales bacterium]|nr:signal peptide protein [Verrucomicrobiales bacterium]
MQLEMKSQGSKHRSGNLVACVSLMVWLATFCGRADNWPQWRGPLATGVAPNGTPPTVWSETNHIRWKVRVPGSGTGTPIIWDKQLFIETAIPIGKKSGVGAPLNSPLPDKPQAGPRGGGQMRSEKPDQVYQFVLICLDRLTGKTVWQQIVREEIPHEGFHAGDGSFASSSAVTDGKMVYAYFGSRGLHAYDFSGNKKWEHDFGKLHMKNEFGEGSSPALFGDFIVVVCDQEGDSFVEALDKNTGKSLWKKSREEHTSWATPLIVDFQGKPQVITDASGKIRSYDLATGNVIWECTGLTANVIPTPVYADGLVYCTSGFRGNALLAIKLGATGDLTGTDAIAWSRNKGTPYVPSPLFYNGRLYLFGGNNGILSSLEAKTGKVLIDAERLADIPGVYASPVAAAQHIYLVGRNGTSLVINNSEKLEVLTTNHLDEKFDASPAIAGNELFLRGQEYLYCIAE